MVGGLDRNEVGNFGEPVANNPDRVIPSARPRESGNKVHTDFIPFPLWYLQRLEQSGRTLMLSLDSLTDITSGYERANLSRHTMPPEFLFHILIHLCSSGMDGIRR